VRFHWFAQQYYTQLAADYGDTVRSSWVTAPVAAADPAQVGRDYGMYIRLMQGADQLGWDSLLLNEHHQNSLAMTPSPNLIAAILAHTTENAAIALCGNSLALYNPPLRVAEEMAMLDCLSGGRLIAGMVFGTPMDSAFSYGVPPVELRERFYEARELITRAWKATEPFAFNGKYTKLRYVNPWPRPVQADLPIWVGGQGERRTLRIAARWADGWNAPFVAPETFAHKRGVLHAHCTDAGRDPDELRIAVNVGLAWTEESLRQQFGGLADFVRPGVLTGSEEEVLDRVGQYVDAGADQVNLALRAPFDTDALERFAAALGLS
jgi:alkanesulfonate monooxygenase SsuD/methylene tetrahydromethanopterin reductase-like flavin-dependent oxidoreductase (luciferase family)